MKIFDANHLLEVVSSGLSKFELLINSSIKLSGLTRVPSTLPPVLVSSVAFFRLSSAAFPRSKEPVSLRPPEPLLAFLVKKKKEIADKSR